MSRLRFEGFELDLQCGELREGGVLLKLQPQPFKVLALLASRAGELVPREEIQKQVWTRDTFVNFEQGVNYCIRQIRAVLRDNAEMPGFVETVPRRGYRFLAKVEEISPPKDDGIARPRVMLAVLPFENLSGSDEQEYFSDGLTDEMIAQLGRLNPQRLGVIARTSAMRYKHAKKGVDLIGRELGVSYVLEGSVRRSDRRIRVTSQLIQVSDQTHVWTQTFDRHLGDVLMLQSEVARLIANAIRVQLTPREQLRLASTPGVDPGTYEAYLKGRYFWNRGTKESLEKSVKYFQQAIASDPGYPPAYAGLADAHLTQLDYNYLPPRDAFALAERVVLDALRLDDTLAEPHTSLGHLRLHELNWSAAEQAFEHAVALNPGYGAAHYYHGNLLAAFGQFDAALGAAQRSVEIDPLSPNTKVNRLFTLYLARRYEEALDHAYEAIEIDPSYIGVHYYMGLIYERQRRYDEAIAALSGVSPLAPTGPTTLAALGYVYAVSGRYQGALDVLSRLTRWADQQYVSSYDLALLHLALNHRDRGFALLSQAYEEHASFLPFLNVDARLDSVRSDPRLTGLVQRMNFPSR